MIDHILVPLDGSSLAESVLPHLLGFTQVFESRVTLVRVQERRRAGSVDPLNWHLRKAEAKAYLEEVAARLQTTGLRVEAIVLEAQAAERILQFAHGQQADLLLLSSHVRSVLSGWNISGLLEKIVLRASTSTMIVRASHPTPGELAALRYRRLLVPLDGSQRAEYVLPLATALARAHESELLLAHVVRQPEMPRRVPPTQEDIELINRITARNQEEAARYLDQFQSRLSLDVQIRLSVSENTAASLHELAEKEEVDLVLLSAHGYSAATRWPFGSVAMSFIAYGVTPFLIMQDVPPPEAEPARAEVASREWRRG